MIGGDEKSLLFFYIGERPWNAARQLSDLVEVDERFKSYFHDYKMNRIEITGNTSYNFNEEDVHNLFYICRSIYEGKNTSFWLVKSGQDINGCRMVEFKGVRRNTRRLYE